MIILIWSSSVINNESSLPEITKTFKYFIYWYECNVTLSTNYALKYEFFLTIK